MPHCVAVAARRRSSNALVSLVLLAISCSPAANASTRKVGTLPALWGTRSTPSSSTPGAPAAASTSFASTATCICTAYLKTGHKIFLMQMQPLQQVSLHSQFSCTKI